MQTPRTPTCLLVAVVAVLTTVAGLDAAPVAERRARALDASTRDALSRMHALDVRNLERLTVLTGPRNLRRVSEAILQQPYIVDPDGQKRFILGDERDIEVEGGLRGDVRFEVDDRGEGRFVFVSHGEDGAEQRREDVVRAYRDSLAVSARRAEHIDAEHRSPIHRWLAAQLGDGQRYPGLEYIGSLKGRAPAPVTVDNRHRRAAEAEPGPMLTVGEHQWAISPLWPNGAMPALAPKGGIEGHLIYVGDAELTDFDGLEVEGAIALMEFDGGRNYEDLFAYGARAVIVLDSPEDGRADRVSRQSAEGLFHNTPVPAPRFYISRRELRRVQEAGGPDLRRLAVEAQQHRPQDDGDGQAHHPGRGPAAQVHGGHVWERRPFEAMFYHLPPTDPVAIEIAPEELARRIARQFNTEVRQLAVENPDVNLADLEPGTTLRLPNGDQTYTVAENDLLDRIAREFGIADAEEILDLNGLEEGQPLPAGELRIPNLRQTLFVAVPIDAVSVAPDEPHGAKTAANLAVLLQTLKKLTEPDSAGLPVVRRKPMVIGLLDAEYLGGHSSRAFAEYALRMDGHLGTRDEEEPFPWFAFILGVLIAAGLGFGLAWMLAGGDPDKPNPARPRLIAGLITAICFSPVGGLAVWAGTQRGHLLGELEPEQRLAYYEQIDAWVEDPEENHLDDVVAQWFAEEWLWRRIESARTVSADYAATLGREQANLERGTEAFRELGRRIAEAEALTLEIADLRDDALLARGLTWPQRVQRLWDKLERLEAENELPTPDLALDRFRQRLDLEVADERLLGSYRRNNRRIIRDLVAQLQPRADVDAPGERFGRPTLGWWLALSDGSSSLGLALSQPHFQAQPPAASSTTYTEGLARRMRTLVAYATSRAQWGRDWLFVGGEEDVLRHPHRPAAQPVVYADFWAQANVGLLPLGTVDDLRLRLDTPRDVPRHTDYDNLARLGRTAAMLMMAGLENPSDSPPPSDMSRPNFGQLSGRVLQFSARSGIDAQEPVEDVLVYYPAVRDSPPAAEQFNSATFRGGRRGVMAMSRLNGGYDLPVESLRFFGTVSNDLFTYRLDRDRAVIERVMDEGVIGTEPQSPSFRLEDNRPTLKEVVVTEVYPWVFYPGPDPMNYSILGGTGQEVEIADAVVQGRPSNYGFDNAMQKYGETGTDANILYLLPDRRARVSVRSGTSYLMLLTGEILTAERARRLSAEQGRRIDPAPRGRGFRVGPRDDGDPNIFLSQTVRHIVENWYEVASRRQGQYAARNLIDHSVDEALVRVRELKQEADAALGRGDYAEAHGINRAAWGKLAKAQPRVLQLGREAIFSAIILMGLLVPAAYFLERLLIGSTTVMKRLAGTSIIFALGIVFLQFTHPALLIAVSPFIVIVAFIMILMALIVLGICYGRFDVLVRRARAAAGEVESEEISLTSSLATALSLGVSNLKKRPMRTFLTALTVSILTFSIITFVSVSGRDALLQQPLSLEREIEGEAVDPIPPKYHGVLFREFMWANLPRTFISAVRSEFGIDHDVTVRGFYVEVQGGNNYDRDGRNEEPVRRLERLYQVGEGDSLEAIAQRERVALQRLLDVNEIELEGVVGEVADLPARPDDDDEDDAGDADGGDSNPDADEAAAQAEAPQPQPQQFDDQAIAQPRSPIHVGQTLIIPADDEGFVALAIMGFEYNEPNFTGLNEAVSNRQWLVDDPAHPYQIIIPREAAEQLDIRPEDLYIGTERQIADGTAELRPWEDLPEVELRNIRWRVVGILDTPEADRYRDLTSRSLAMVNWLASGFSPNVGTGEMINEGPSYSHSWRRLVIVPMAVAERVGVQPRSVAIRLDPEVHDLERFRRDIELRLNRTMFGTIDPETGRVGMLTTRAQQSVAGLAQIIVPVLLCVLIVLNTMMGAVEERKAEVSMLGAIGLSPSQISFLLLSESTVFSVLGIVFGTLAGLAFAWFVVEQPLGVEMLSDLSFNFTSVIAMLLAMATGLVVLLATLLPARKAAALAAPSGMARWELPEPGDDGHIHFELPFTLTRGNAVGMMAFFRRFLYNHTEPTSADFNCRHITTALRSGDEDALEIRCDMWLAPYDLDVAQRLLMRVVPTSNQGVFAVHLDLERISGTEEAWMRTNYGFLNLVRHQFLLWRNLDDASRSRYIQEGAAIYREAMS